MLRRGHCDELGRRASRVLLNAGGPRSLTLAWDLVDVARPSEVAERLPTVLIHRSEIAVVRADRSRAGGKSGTLEVMAQKPSSGSTVWKVIVSILVVLLILVIVVEIGLRWYLANQVRTTFNDQARDSGAVVEQDPEVNFGATPLVFGLLQNQLPQMSLRTPSTLQVEGTDISGIPAAQVRVEDLTLGQNPVAGSLRATTEVPEDFLLAVVQREINNQVDGAAAADIASFLGVSNITANPDANALDIELAQGAATISFVPEVVDGQLIFRATNTELFGFDLPQGVSEAITQALQDGVTQGMSGVSGQLRIEDFTVIDGGVRLTVTGRDVPLQDIGGDSGSTGTTPPAESPAASAPAA